MVQLTKIYTRGGDQGETSLGDGSRVAKHDARVEAYGTVDEANAVIGLVRVEIVSAGEDEQALDAVLGRIQTDLFDLGADLCTPENGRRAEGALRIVTSQVEWLEAEIDKINDRLTPLSSFILPGGSPVAANLHLARTVARRAERCGTKLARSEAVNTEAVKYLTRLSDLLFVMSRATNNNGTNDILWIPGANR